MTWLQRAQIFPAACISPDSHAANPPASHPTTRDISAARLSENVMSVESVEQDRKSPSSSIFLKGMRALTGLLVFLILAAPPVMKYVASSTGRLDTRIFGPVIWIWERDWGEPYVWYFNSVWNSEVLMSSGAPPPWYSGPIFVLVIVAALVFVFWPGWKRRSRSVQGV